MRYLVNGHPAELSPTVDGVSLARLSDRLMVRSPRGTASAVVVRSGDKVLVSYRGRVYTVEQPTPGGAKKAAGGSGESRSPMPGAIVEVFVSPGETVEAGQKLLVLEAMKMQHPVTAPFAGTVAEVPVAKGDQVGDGQLLVRVDPLPPAE